MPWQLPAAAGFAVLALWTAGTGPAAVAGVALAAVAPELALVDAREHRLPNRMTLPALGVGAVGAASSALTGGTTVPLLAAAAFGGGMLVLAMVGGVGMGDAKLAALIGLASPTALIAVSAPVLGMLAGGMAGTAALLRRGAGRRIAFGPFLLLGWGLALALQAGLDLGPRLGI